MRPVFVNLKSNFSPAIIYSPSILLQVDDQMKLLQHSWSDMLVLDHIHQRMHNNLQDETTLHNGQKFDLLSLGLLGVPSLQDRFTQVTHTLHDLKFDVSDYICLKFLLLLNPGKLIRINSISRMVFCFLQM